MPATLKNLKFTPRDGLFFFGLCAIFCACGFFSVVFTKEFGRVSCLWPANAVVLATVLRLDDRRRLLALFAAFIGNMIVSTYLHPIQAGTIAASLCNVIEITICLVLLERILKTEFDITSLRHVRWGLFACITGAMISGLGSVTIGHLYWGRVFAENYVIWVCAHTLGLMVFTPLFLVLSRHNMSELFAPEKIRRTVQILTLLVLTLGTVFFQDTYPLTFIPLGVLVFASFQLGVAGAAISVVITALVVIAGAVTDHGPISLLQGTLSEKVIVTQIFIGVCLLVSLPVATAVEQRARLAEDLIEQKEAAQRANQAKSEFLTSMSHELRTPLNAISGFAQLLQLDKNRDEREREYIDYIMKSGDHLIKLVGDVLDLAKVEAGHIEIEKQVFSANELVNEVGAVLMPLAIKKDITLNINIPAYNAYLETDVGRLKQVLINFGSNAIKYNTPKGSANISMTTDNDHVRITVADTGLGISPEHQANLFKPFNRLGHENGPIEGTGIGLAISKSLIEAMGGTMGCESALGFGTRFWIDLPLSEGKLVAAPSATLAFEKTINRMTILYIEDNKANAHLMSSITRDFLGADLVIADTGKEGLETARMLQPDLIISDIHLPDINGYDLFRQLRDDALTTKIPIIAVTADAMPHTVERARKAGFDDFFTKPFQVPDMLRAIQALVPATA